MTVTRGKEHLFLGREIVFKEDGTVQTKMNEYIKDAIDGFKDDITKSVVTPVTQDLFEVNEDCPKLSVEDSENHRSLFILGVLGEVLMVSLSVSSSAIVEAGAPVGTPTEMMVMLGSFLPGHVRTSSSSFILLCVVVVLYSYCYLLLEMRKENVLFIFLIQPWAT